MLRTVLTFASLAALAACTVTSTPGPAHEAPSEEPDMSTPADDDRTPAPGAADDDAKDAPAKPAVIDEVVLSGQFDEVDVLYDRAGKFIVLDMKGKATGLESSVKGVSASALRLEKTTSYDLLFPSQGACDSPPELSIEGGVLRLELQRAGSPNGTISGCYYLAGSVRAPDGGFQARVADVPIAGGGTIKELVIDVAGPAPK
jgi:hypothetical protein